MIYTKRTYIHLYTFGAQKLRSSTKWHIRKSLLPTDLILQVHRDASLTQERLGPKSMSQLGSTSQFLGWKIQYGWKLKPCGKVYIPRASIKQWKEDIYDGMWQFVGPGSQHLWNDMWSWKTVDSEGSAMEYPDKYVASSLVFNPANFECHDFFVIFSAYRTPELWKLPVLMSHPTARWGPPCHQRAHLMGSKVQVPYSNISGWFLVLGNIGEK